MEKESRNYVAHCLILPYPAQGHVNPMLQFAKRLVKKGVKVTLVTVISHWKTLSTKDFTSIEVESISDGYNGGGLDAAESLEIYKETFWRVGPETLGEVIQKLQSSSNPVDCVIYDAFLAWALDVAKKFGLPAATFFTQSCSVNNIYFQTYEKFVELPLSKTEYLLPGLPKLAPGDLPSFLNKYGSYPGYFDIVVNQFSNIGKANWVLANTFYELEKEKTNTSVSYSLSRLSPEHSPLRKMASSKSTSPSTVNEAREIIQKNLCPGPEVVANLEKDSAKLAIWKSQVVDWLEKIWPIKTVGPTLPSIYLDKRLQDDKDYGISMYNPDTEASIKWLNEKPKDSVVYVSFGSLANLNEEQMEELAYGLRDSGNYFIWVVRESEQSKLPKDFLEQTEKGIIVNWSPQLQVLTHEAVKCFLTHCGWNSTMEAVSLGVPLIAMPLWTDQITNGKHIADVWKIGVRAVADEKDVVRRETIKHCIKEVMENEKGNEIKNNAIKWKNLARKAIDEGGSSDKNTAEFVAALDQYCGNSH